MRIGELAQRVGVSTDTIRFYERAGWLPRATRQRDNSYRQYSDADVEHLRLLIDLRRLDIPLEQAAQVAGWCHAGHCAQSTEQLPALLASHRAEIRQRITRLRGLERQLSELEDHLRVSHGRDLPVLDTGSACCAAASAVVASTEGCACSSSVPDGRGLSW